MFIKIFGFIKTAWYWFFSGLFLLIFFVNKEHSFSQVLFFITFLLPVIIGTSYYVNNRLIQDFLLRNKNKLFILYSIYTIIISLYFQYLVIFLALFVFTSFQLDNKYIVTMNIGNLSLILYILVLVNALIRIIEKLNQKDTIIKSLKNKKLLSTEPEISKIDVRYNRTNHSIALSTILYIESLSDYIKIVTIEEDIITKEKISKIIERLPAYFLRTHRSFIVNSQKIKSYNKEIINLHEHNIPISRTYKKAITEYLSR